MSEVVLGVHGAAASVLQGADIGGTLHIFVAFDWGEEIRFDQAARQVPGSLYELPRRRRTPSSFSYRPAPMHLAAPDRSPGDAGNWPGPGQCRLDAV